MSPNLHLQFKDVRDEGQLVTVPWKIVQALFKDNKSLQQHLDTLRKIDDAVLSSDLQSTINEAMTAAHTLDRFVSQLWNTCPPHFHPSEGPAAKAVFKIPELLEKILSNLKGRDLLSAQQTNMLFRDVINRSPFIQKTLGLQPDGHSHFYSPFETSAMDFGPPYTPLWPQTRLPDTDMGPMRGLQFCVGAHGRAPPLPYSPNHVYVTGRIDSMPTEVGKRCLRMLICQPPVREMSIYFCQTDHESRSFVIRSAAFPNDNMVSLSPTSCTLLVSALRKRAGSSSGVMGGTRGGWN